MITTAYTQKFITVSKPHTRAQIYADIQECEAIAKDCRDNGVDDSYYEDYAISLHRELAAFQD